MNCDISNEKKEIFHQVRMHLKLLTASDIVIANHGNRVIPGILKGENLRISTLNWPRILPFPKKWISVFANIILTAIAPTLRSSPLGHWRRQGHQRWEYFQHHNEVKYVRYNKPVIITNSQTTNLQLLIDIDTRNGNIIGYQNIKDLPTQQDKPTSPCEALQQAPR